jgi:hypothetical protein
MPYFIARLAGAQAGVSENRQRVLVHADDETSAKQVIEALEASLETRDTREEDSRDVQENLFAEPELLAIPRSTWGAMKRILPAYAQHGLDPDEDNQPADVVPVTPSRLRPLAEAVSEVLSRSAICVDADVLERSFEEAARCPSCAGIFAESVLCPREEGQAEESHYQFGPRLFARVQVQAWQDNYAVDIDGTFEQDVTATVLTLPLETLRAMKDDSDIASELVNCPGELTYRVMVVDALLDFFQVSDTRELSQEMLDAARIRASLDPTSMRSGDRAHRVTFALGDEPYTTAELETANWTVDCVIPVPAHSTYSDSVLERAISKVVTGSEIALADVRYERATEDYGSEFVALHITGKVHNPRNHFELDAETALPRSRELRSFLNALGTADVFEMNLGGTSRRYHILAVNEDKLSHLWEPGVTKEALEALGLKVECAVEFTLAGSAPDVDVAHAGDDEEYFSLTELFSATYCEDNSWLMQLDSGEQVNLCFF